MQNLKNNRSIIFYKIPNTINHHKYTSTHNIFYRKDTYNHITLRQFLFLFSLRCHHSMISQPLPKKTNYPSKPFIQSSNPKKTSQLYPIPRFPIRTFQIKQITKKTYNFNSFNKSLYYLTS